MNPKPCFRCGNQNYNLFYLNNHKWYCRRCIDFNKPVLKINKFIAPKNVLPNLTYNLSDKQLKLSHIINQSKSDIYVSAVTGSGKTEVTLKVIAEAIKKGMRVGFIIPRKAIVIEIAARLRKIFPSLKVVEVYHDTKYDYDGDIVVLTAHQSYRYINKFGLIIIDEYDAFPLIDNQVLKDIVNRTCFGKRVYLSATFKEADLINKKVGYLNSRYHNKPLPQPEFNKTNNITALIKLIGIVKHNKSKRIIIYFPTIKILKMYLFLISFAARDIIVIHSKIKQAHHLIKQLVVKEKFIVFSTILLERGITIPRVNVYVFNADHILFSKANLIQIAGRVGRVKAYPEGEVVFFGNRKSKNVVEAIEHISTINHNMYHLPKSGQ